MNHIVCYSNEGTKTQDDFLKDIHALHKFAAENQHDSYILHSEDLYWFAVAFIGVLRAKKILAISSNASQGFIKEICDEKTAFISEEQIKKICDSGNFASAEWLPIDLQADVVLWTSGTTGKPKKIHKKFKYLNAECEELARLWGKTAENCLFCETVSHHHIYGLLLSFLLPLRLNAPFVAERIEAPGALEKFRDRNIILVSSPAFLKRISESDNFSDLPISRVFCSGGVLLFESAKNTERAFGQWPVEIYGSTETGGIAYRVSKNGLEWQPFAACSLSLADNGCLCVKSPYIAEKNGFVTGDLAEFLDNGKFTLNGRADSIVKIEEKRISLPEVEKRILSCGLVQDVCVVALSSHRQYLAAAIVLNQKGEEKFSKASAFQKNSFFREYLSSFLEGVVIPKKWRYVKAFAQDNQGKIKRKEIEALFLPKTKENYRILSISFENSEESEKKIIVDLLFPKHSDFFDGHFPLLTLLPGVAQVDTVIRISNKYLNSPMILKKIPKAKFTSPIYPDAQVCLHICYREKEKTLNFEFYSKQNKRCSSGTLFYG
ncbi:MAG: AMP-binding protein [Fibromonadales bacterium]|nr:AMP-binding protein [Fibromonadales bacterium]